MKEKQIPLTVINPQAAGIDVGSRTHFVAIGQEQKEFCYHINPQAAGIDVGSRTHFVAIGQEQKDVKSFGVYAEDLTALTQWLIEKIGRASCRERV